jgi:hypothetical protein
MEEIRLTDNGVDKMLAGISNVVVQVLNLVEKNKGNQKYFR